MQLIKQNTKIDFLGAPRRRIALGISVVFVVASLVAIVMRGLNFGIDFTGGVLLEVGYESTADLDAIRSSLESSGFENALVQRFGADTDVLVRLPPQEGAEPAEIRRQLQDTLAVAGQDVELRRVEFVSPQVGGELAEQGSLALLIAMLMIFAYIMFRFQWKFAAGAVVALAHDVIITVGFFALFQFAFDLTVVAAILAVIGYSLNDTVVIFDRIRENFFKLRGMTAIEMMNKSVNETLSRTLITSGSTTLVLVALLILGGESIASFSIALIVGIVVGTYSSIFMAAAVPLLLDVTPVDLVEPVKDPKLIDDMP